MVPLLQSAFGHTHGQAGHDRPVGRRRRRSAPRERHLDSSANRATSHPVEQGHGDAGPVEFLRAPRPEAHKRHFQGSAGVVRLNSVLTNLLLHCIYKELQRLLIILRLGH